MNSKSTDTKLDRLDLAAIEARANAATEGPWRNVVIDADISTVWAGGNTIRTAKRIVRSGQHGDAEFIAHAREDVPVLLAEVERLRAAVERVRALHAKRDVFEVGPDGILGGWRSSGCEARSDPDLIADLEDGELTEELVPWPCATIEALNGANR